MSLKPCQSKEGEIVRNTVRVRGRERERERERLLKCSWQCSATIREIPQTFISSQFHAQPESREREREREHALQLPASLKHCHNRSVEYELVSQIDVSCLKKSED